MERVQSKNIFITLLAVLIFSATFAKPNIELKNNSDISSMLYSLKAPDTNFLLLKVAESKEALPKTPQKAPFESKIENNDDGADSDDDVYTRFSYVFRSLFTRLTSSTVSFENTDSPRFVFVPLYILFHSWKIYLL